MCDWFAATDAYLHETTIHGFRYLAPDEIGSRNLLEFFFWVSGIVAAFAATTLMLYQSFDEGRKFPILTTVDTINVNKVPFPAITVDAGEVVNPWGHAERLIDLFDYECYDTPYGCPEKEALREAGMVVIKATVTVFFEKYKLRVKEWPLSKLKKSRYPFCLYDDFARAVAILAVIKQKDKDYGRKEVPKWLVNATADVFGRYNNRKTGDFAKEFNFNWGRDHFYPKIKEEQLSYDISDEDVQACLDEGEENCSKYIDAFRILVLPNFVFRVPFQGLGAGEFISYFTRRAVSASIKSGKEHHDVQTVFLTGSGNNNKPNEILVAEFLGDLMKFISNQRVDMNSFEMINLLDMPHRINEGVRHASYYGDRYNCTLARGDNAGKYFEQWNSYIKRVPIHQHTHKGVISERPCSNDTDAVEKGIDGCCKLARLMAEEHELVARILKHAMQPPHFTLSEEEFNCDFGNLSEIVPFPIKTYDEPPINENPRIFQCRYNQDPIEDGQMPFCNIFARSYSNEGYAYSFNNRHFWNKHRKDNTYNRRFYNIFHPVPTTDFPDIIYPATSGSSYGLSFALQLNKYQDAAKDDASRAKIVPMFKVAIHDPQKPADLRSEGVMIEPGYTSTFLITPSQVFTSDNVKKLEVDKRKCKFHSENEGLKIFTEYTKQGCVLECKLLQADARCGCLPWNYPSPVNTSICDYMGNYCFEEV